MRTSWWKFMPSLAVVGVFAVGTGCGLKTAENRIATDAEAVAVPDKGKIAATGVMQIMQKLGRGPQAASNVLSNELKSDKPDWNVVQARATEISKLATDLAKLDPPRGSKELWQKNNTDFLEAAGAIARAAKDQNLDSAKASQAMLGASCTQCHNDHKKKGKGA
jgi:cytochrome c556